MRLTTVLLLFFIFIGNLKAQRFSELDLLFSKAQKNHIKLLTIFKKDRKEFFRVAPEVMSELNYLIDSCYEEESCIEQEKTDNIIYKSKLLIKIINEKFAIYYFDRALEYHKIKNYRRSLMIFSKIPQYKNGKINARIMKYLKSCTLDYECMMALSKYKKPVLRKVKVITFDTRSSGVCERLEEILKDVDDIEVKETLIYQACGEGVESGIKQLYIHEDRDYSKNEISYSLNKSKDPRFHRLMSDNSYTVLLGGLIMAALYVAPESISNWNDEDKKGDLQHKLERYSNYVSSKPVMDEDANYMNYILHPAAGAFYYLRARKAGFGVLSVINGIFMSTFFWEYGVEGFMEPPSIQDLIVTPFVGALVGELAFQLTSYIDRNSGRLFGSKKIGTFVKKIVDPGELILRGLKKILKPISKNFDNAGFKLFFRRQESHSTRERESSEIGLIFELAF